MLQLAVFLIFNIALDKFKKFSRNRNNNIYLLRHISSCYLDKNKISDRLFYGKTLKQENSVLKEKIEKLESVQ
jgi:hypothetical protein